MSIAQLFLSASDLLAMGKGEERVSDSLRGWSWQEPPVAPLIKGVYLPVSEVASRYCPTMRDLYVRHVENVKARPSKPMAEGAVIHEVVTRFFIEFKRLAYSGLGSGFEIVQRMSERCDLLVSPIVSRYESILDGDAERVGRLAKNVLNYFSVQLAAAFDRVIIHAPSIEEESLVDSIASYSVQRRVDGSLVGLSRWLMVDILVSPALVIELKVGDRRDFHKLSLAGYALALESTELSPVNAGAIVYIRPNGSTFRVDVQHYFIGDEIRREFLEARDQAMELIYRQIDPGKPLSCPTSCPFYGYCWEGETG